MEELSEILWRERELLDMLLYKLEQQQLVLTVGKTRWLGTAAGEIEAVALLLRQTEVLRIAAHDEAARDAGLPATVTLSELAHRADEPWASILLDHRDSLASCTREIAHLAASNRELLTAGAQVARELLLSVSAEGSPEAPEVLTAAVGPGGSCADRSS